MLYIQTSMMKETKNQVWTTTWVGELSIDPITEFDFVRWKHILETLLHVSMAIFFPIEIGRIGRQPLLVDLRMLAEIPSSALSLMRGSMIPNQDE